MRQVTNVAAPRLELDDEDKAQITELLGPLIDAAVKKALEGDQTTVGNSKLTRKQQAAAYARTAKFAPPKGE